MIETQRKRRGHAFMPPPRKAIPDIYDTEDIPAEDKIIYVHYFASNVDFYIAEMNFENGDAFGYTRFTDFPEGAEWGYIGLEELEQLSVHGGLIIVERDLYWEPVKFKEIKING